MTILQKFSLNGRNILLTGATGNLGKAMAWALAEAGGHIYVNSRSHEKCKVLVDAITKAGYSAQIAVFDVENENEVSQFFSNTKLYELHCLINNAYAGMSGTIETAETKDYLKSFEISVIATHNLFRHSLLALRQAVAKSGDASVINIASMYGIVSPDIRIYKSLSTANPPFYGTAKAALLQWTRYAACQYGREGIRVNSISPGPFPSDLIQKNSPDVIKFLKDKVPLGRIGMAHEIQGAVLLLASQASTYINGSNLTIDGGWTSW